MYRAYMREYCVVSSIASVCAEADAVQRLKSMCAPECEIL